jgi:hypothetical protein
MGWVFALIIILVLAVVIGFQTSRVGDASAASSSLEGAWTVTVSPEGGEPFTDGAIFHSDGTATVFESGGVGPGVWEKLSGDSYAFTFHVFITDGATFLKAKVRSTVKLSADKEHYSGPYFFQVFDLDGNLIVEGPGTAEGVRQHLELMP